MSKKKQNQSYFLELYPLNNIGMTMKEFYGLF